jgi:hypothetical protein
MLISTIALAQINPGDVLINEVGIVEPGTDDEEFIELYGPGLLDISTLEVVLFNGNGGASYDTIDLAGQVIPADGFFVIAGGPLVPTADLIDGPATNFIQNGDPDSVVLRRKSDSVVIDAVAYFATYDASQGGSIGVPWPGGLAATDYEGDLTGNGGDDTLNIQWGPAPSTPVDNTSIGRYPDGNDSDDNFTDFTNQFQGRSPGTANSGLNVVPGAVVPEDFNPGVGLIQAWSPSWVDIVLDNVATCIPPGIPPSPDPMTPVDWASVKDNTGGGDQAIMVDCLAMDANVSAFFFCGPISTLILPDNEYGGLFARLNSDHQNNYSGYYDRTVPIGRYGDSYYGLEMDYVTGTVEAINVFKCNRTSLTIAGPYPPGWHLLEINMVAGTVEYWVDGVNIFTLLGETPRFGYTGVGYREVDSVGVGTVRNNFDFFQILPGAVDVGDWMMY